MEFLQEITEFLDALPVNLRTEVLQELRERAKFCWECGMDYHNPQRICHCMNDD